MNKKFTTTKNKTIAAITLGVVVVFGFGYFAGGWSSKNGANTEKTHISSSASKETKTTVSKTVNFFAPGKYKVGIDIQPGSYYAVLTDIQFASSDDKHSGYINIDVTNSSKESKFYEGLISDVNKPYRITLKKGDTVILSDNYSPTWNVSFFTSEDYKEYQASDKTTASSSSTSSATPEPTTTKEVKKVKEQKPSDYIQTTPDELFDKFDNGELKVGERYEFVGSPFNSAYSGVEMGAGGYGYYNINVRARDDEDGLTVYASSLEDCKIAYTYENVRFKVLVKNIDGVDDGINELYLVTLSEY